MTSVSVVINAFNYGRYLARAIDSVLKQRSNNVQLQVVVVDDGSTDDTASVAARYGSTILYHRKPNGGQASAIQEGLRLADGDIVSLLDADDEFYDTKIQRIVDAFRTDPASGAVYNSYTMSGESGLPLGSPCVWNRSPSTL